MKKIISSSIVFSLIIGVFVMTSNAVSAQTNADVSTQATVNIDGVDRKVPVTIRSAQQQKLDAQREGEMEARKRMEEKMRAEKMGDRMMSDKPTDRAGFVSEFKNRFERTIKLLESIHARLTGIAERIGNRIEKLSLDSSSSTESKKYLALAREDLRKAKAEIEIAMNVYAKEVDINTTATSTRPANIGKYFETNFSNTHTHVKMARELLKSAHKNLVSATRSLKPGIGGSENLKIKATSEAKVDVVQ